GVRSNSSARRPASDPRSLTAGPPSNKCDVAASCTHSIFARRLECCAHQLNPPRKAAVRFEQTDKIRLGAQLSLPLIARFSRNETANVSFSLSQHICNTTI